MPVITCGSEIADSTFDITDLIEQLIVNLAIDPGAIVKRKGGVEREALKVSDGVNILLSVIAVLEQFFDRNVGFQVNDWHIGLNGWTVESRGGCLSSLFARFVPGRGADCKALGTGYDGVEGVQGGTRNEG